MYPLKCCQVSFYSIIIYIHARLVEILRFYQKYVHSPYLYKEVRNRERERPPGSEDL